MAKKTNLTAATTNPATRAILEASGVHLDPPAPPPPDPPASKDKPVRINVHVPPDLHRAFKLKAVQDGRSHQDILLDAIRRYLEA